MKCYLSMLKCMNEQLKNILESIEQTLHSCHRTDTVDVLAVTKTHPPEVIKDAIESGLTLLGENRVQEIESKFPIEDKEYSLHLIGHLQSNKIRKVLPYVDAIDSVDSLQLLKLIDKEAKRIEKIVPILFEINTSLESSKIGFTDEKEYFKALEVASELSHIQVKGLMTVGPLSSDEQVVRSAFASLKELQHKSQTAFPQLDFTTLSMGMSYDYLWAIKEGSTVVRLGSALFGSRSYT